MGFDFLLVQPQAFIEKKKPRLSRYTWQAMPAFTLIFAQLSEHLSDILFDLSVYDLSPVFRRKYDMIFTFTSCVLNY